MKVLVTGGTGMLGSSFKNFTEETILIGSKDFDLTKEDQIIEMLEKYKPDTVIHCAAKCGGVLANLNNMFDYYNDNIIMNSLLMKHSYFFGVENFIGVLSSCAYPKNSALPLVEENYHKGEPFESHYSYAYTKRMLDIQTRAIKKQHNKDYLCIIPNNLYGINDNYHLENSHVVPALIRKIYEAKINNKDVTLWGDGSPLREFTYSKDIPKICKFLLKNKIKKTPLNIGNTNEISIKDLSKIISKHLQFEGKVFWDNTKPNGQFRKPTSNQKLLNLGWKKESYTSLEDGIKENCNWFVKNYPNIRGI